MRISLKLIFATILPLSACATGSPQIETTRVAPVDTFLVSERPPVIEARREGDLALASAQAGRVDRVRLAAREGSRRVGGEALPFLTRTEAGQAFLALEAPRAIARGAPAEICPAVGVAGGAGTPGGTADAARAALATCLAGLGAGERDCGCRIVALDDMLTVPLADVSYAVGVTARLYAPDLGRDVVVVAEDIGAGETLLRDLSGAVAIVRHLPERRVQIALVEEDGIIFEGRSIPTGFRRGRVAERIYARDGAGRQLSLLIGYSPAEIAARAGAWLIPPRG